MEEFNSEILCPIHKIPYSGICGEKDCYSSGLICTSCNKGTCIEVLGHRKIPIEEFYNKYIKKLRFLIDFKKLNEIIKLGIEVQKKELELQEKAFEKWEIEMINEKFGKFKEKIIKKFRDFKLKLLNKLEEINIDFENSKGELNLSNNGGLSDFNLENTIKFINENKDNKEELERFLDTIKKFMNEGKIIKTHKDLKNIIYGKYLFDYLCSYGGAEKVNFLKPYIENLSKEIIKIVFPPKGILSIFFDQNSINFNSLPEDLKYKETLTTKSQKNYTIDSLFDVYYSFDGNCYLATSVSTSYDIEIYNLKLNSLAGTLKGHTSHLYIIRHYPQYSTKTNYLISTCTSRVVRVWNLNTYQIFQTIKNCHFGAYIYSALLLFDDYQNNYIITSCPNEYMKVWNFETGEFVRDIGGNNDYTYFINYWKNNNKYYIINANSDNIKIYGMEKIKDLYGEYAGEKRTWHMSAFVQKISGVDYLFETDGNGYVRLWNLTTDLIYKTIYCQNCSLRGICLWNNKYLLVASSDKTIKIINFMEEKLVASLEGFHSNSVCTLIKIKHPKYGESLLSGSIDGTIKLWINKNFA